MRGWGRLTSAATEKKMHRITIIDSHSGGEPTRVVTSGGPDLGSGPLLLGTGSVTICAEIGILERWEIVDTIHMWWPAALILFGGALLLNSKDTRTEQPG